MNFGGDCGPLPLQGNGAVCDGGSIGGLDAVRPVVRAVDCPVRSRSFRQQSVEIAKRNVSVFIGLIVPQQVGDGNRQVRLVR